MASLEWSVDRLAVFLDRFPNANVDIAARMTQIQYQSNQDREKVRDFFIKYQDRLMYGTDIADNPPNPTRANDDPPTSARPSKRTLIAIGVQTGAISRPRSRSTSTI